jgi:hypothetical protein
MFCGLTSSAFSLIEASLSGASAPHWSVVLSVVVAILAAKRSPFAGESRIYSYVSDENVFFAIAFSLSFMLGAPCAPVRPLRIAAIFRRSAVSNDVVGRDRPAKALPSTTAKLCLMTGGSPIDKKLTAYG